jgi:radical SAM protein with 4Fe4S-binding SPASM domain
MKVINLSLSGGEPLLHPNFCSFVNKAKECDFSIDVFSNLTLLNNEILSVMKNDIYSIFHVSLYSLNPSVHDSITQVAGSFEKTFSGILELLNNEIPLQINCMVMKQNKDCFTDVIKWGHERNIKIGVDTMMMAMNNHDTSNLKNRLSLKETKKALRDIISTDLIFQKNILSSEFDYFLNNRKNIINESVCGICQSSLSMDSFGNIIPCPGWDSYIMGNIAKQPLKTIWEKSQFVQNLREIKRNDFKKCRNCDDIGFCSLCMADNANANLNGNPILINKHICKVASLNHKIVMDWKTKHQKGENNDSTKYDFESLALRDTSKLEAVL